MFYALPDAVAAPRRVSSDPAIWSTALSSSDPRNPIASRLSRVKAPFPPSAAAKDEGVIRCGSRLARGALKGDRDPAVPGIQIYANEGKLAL